MKQLDVVEEMEIIKNNCLNEKTTMRLALLFHRHKKKERF
jgi:hypothetical protein